jgi:hypothetical protein
MVSLESLRRDYEAVMNQLASALGLEYKELAGFLGGIENGSFGARRLKEFFRSTEIVRLLDRLAEISDQYRNETLPGKT